MSVLKIKSMTITPQNIVHIVVMGVSGTGKTELAHRLHHRTGFSFAEGDDLHPASNVQKMSAGNPLTDEDRAPWLADIAAWATEQAAQGKNTIITCSALKKQYRNALRTAPGRVIFLHLTGSKELIADRMTHRRGHFMPTTLLDSQLATLEPLEADELGFTLDITPPLDDIAYNAENTLTQTYGVNLS